MANKVKISPQVLKWARESLHLPKEEVLVHFKQKTKQKFKVDQNLLDKIESGDDEEIKFTLLQEFSSLYKRPLAIFFLNSPPGEPPLPKDRRTIGSDVHQIVSPKAVLAIRRARHIQSIFSELSKELEVNLKFPFKKFLLSDDSTKIGEKFREILKFSFTEQKKIKNSRELFNVIRGKLESINVFTIKSSFPLEDARAFSFVDKLPYLILINNKDGGYFGYAPKTFSLLHEFAHILLRESAICNDFSNSHLQIEKFCNSFAASFLVTDIYFWEALGIDKKKFKISEIENYIEELQKVFKVSKEVLLRKCLTLNLIDNSFYERKVKQWKIEYEKTRQEKAGKEFVPAITSGRRSFSNNGKTFVELVLHARYADKITVDSAADYLGVNLKSLPEIEELSIKSHANE